LFSPAFARRSLEMPRMSPVLRFSRILARLLLTGLLLIGCAGVQARLEPSPVPSIEATSVRTTPAGTTLAPRDPQTVVRTFTDADGRTITLYYGRGLGRRGDWGWAHIINKHLYGEWSDGGPVTTFDVIGLASPEEVQNLIGRTLRQDARPDPSSNGRREYRLPVDNGYEMLVVVGSDGAIITAYPDRPRRSRP
jgi:hypothetical protein